MMAMQSEKSKLVSQLKQKISLANINSEVWTKMLQTNNEKLINIFLNVELIEKYIDTETDYNVTILKIKYESDVIEFRFVKITRRNCEKNYTETTETDIIINEKMISHEIVRLENESVDYPTIFHYESLEQYKKEILSEAFTNYNTNDHCHRYTIACKIIIEYFNIVSNLS